MEVVNSFFSNIKDKLTNPYFGTLIVVLIIHHWELIFGIFNFDEGFTLDKKIEFVKNYSLNNITWKSFLWDALQALFYMLIGYLIVVLTRSIVLFIEFGLMPFITGKIVNKNVVRRTEYEEVVKEREQYFDQYEEQRENVRNFSRTIDAQTEQIKEKDKNLLEQSNSISKALKELDLSQKRLAKSVDENNERSKIIERLENSIAQHDNLSKFCSKKLMEFRNLFFGKENESFYSSVDKFPPQIINKVNQLKKANDWNEFLQLGDFYKNGGSMGGKTLTKMINYGLASARETTDDLTPIGEIIYQNKNVFDNLTTKELLLLL